MFSKLATFLMLAGCLVSVVDGDAAEGKKKGKVKDKTGAVGAQDGQDDVVGAMWHVFAENAKSGKKEQFKFRVKDGVVSSTEGKKIGAVSSIANTKPGEVKSKMVWRESVPLIGEFMITQAKKGVWGGTLKTKEGDEWKCKLEVLDR